MVLTVMHQFQWAYRLCWALICHRVNVSHDITAHSTMSQKEAQLEGPYKLVHHLKPKLKSKYMNFTNLWQWQWNLSHRLGPCSRLCQTRTCSQQWYTCLLIYMMWPSTHVQSEAVQKKLLLQRSMTGQDVLPVLPLQRIHMSFPSAKG